MRERMDEELNELYGKRLGEVEKAVQRIIGGLIVIGALAGGGFVGLVLHAIKVIP